MINVIECFLMDGWTTSQNDVIINTKIFFTFLLILLYLHIPYKTLGAVKIYFL